MDLQENNFKELLEYLPKDVVSIRLDKTVDSMTYLLKIRRRIPYVDVRGTPHIGDKKSLSLYYAEMMPKSLIKNGNGTLVKLQVEQDFLSLDLLFYMEYRLQVDLPTLYPQLKNEIWNRYSDNFDKLLEQTLTSKVE